MTDRKSISIDEDLYADLKSQKQGDESWPECLRRLTKREIDGRQDERSPDALTEDHIDDIASRTARRTADELETRLR